MFTETTYDAMWGHRSRRGWTTIASFMVQSLGIGILLVLPITHPETLPTWTQVSRIWSTPPVPAGQPPRPNTPSHARPGGASNLWNGRLLPIDRIPNVIPRIDDHGENPVGDSCTACVPGAGPGDPNAVPYGFGPSGWVPAMPRLAPHASTRVSVIMTGYLIHRVEPVYPPLAKIAHVQGPVLLSAVISRQGTIENLQVLSGHPMLARAARDAVAQWRYRPYVLNGEPVEVETQVTVNFVLAGR